MTERERFTAAFTLWEQGFRDFPDEYLTREEIEAESAASYGESAAKHFLKLLAVVDA